MPITEEKKRPRIVIAEDAVLIQENIRRVIQRECDVVAAVEDGEAVMDAVAAYSPDILLLDVSLPGMNGFAVAEQLRQARYEVNVIFVTAHRDKEYANRAFEIGAKGYILKGSMWTELLQAIHAVTGGGCFRSALVS
ncbi:MAG: response regulator transcription factor [Bryobacteraceae bacterium]